MMILSQEINFDNLPGGGSGAYAGVTESLVDDGTLFFSEKIWKPLMVGHPFLLYGNQYSLKYLRHQIRFQ